MEVTATQDDCERSISKTNRSKSSCSASVFLASSLLCIDGMSDTSPSSGRIGSSQDWIDRFALFVSPTIVDGLTELGSSACHILLRCAETLYVTRFVDCGSVMDDHRSSHDESPFASVHTQRGLALVVAISIWTYIRHIQKQIIMIMGFEDMGNMA